MKLYYAGTSPYVRKVLVCAHELALMERIELVPVIVAPHTPNRDYAERNPLMKIPALERDDGVHLVDSIVICEYLDSLAGHRLFPRAGDARWLALRLHALADGMIDAALLARYESAVRPGPLLWPEWLDGQFAKIDTTLAALERDPSQWDGEFGIGEIALSCALGYLDFRFAHRPWRPSHPKLAAWFADVETRPSLAATKPPQ